MLTVLGTASFIVFKRSGEPTSLAEATDLLGQLGQVAKAEFVQENIQASLHIPRAVLVTYKMYDNRRDPVKVKLLHYLLPHGRQHRI